jgi:type IV pilus assembly protein PilA
MRRILRGTRHGERGFTLIELLIVVAILGVIAAVVVPNVTGFMTTGTLNAANTEAQNVRTAVLGYYAENSSWPVDTTDAKFGQYLTGSLKATYTFERTGPNAGLISGATATPGTGWSGIVWSSVATDQKWIKQ